MPSKILVVGPSWVGDMVMAQALCKAIKSQHVACSIDVLAPLWSHPILARMPEVNQSYVMPIGHGRLQILSRYKIAKQLRLQHYTHAYVLPNSFKSALIPWLARIPRRIGYIGEMRWGLLNVAYCLDKKKHPLMVQRYLALAFAKGASFDEKHFYPSLLVKQDEVDNVQRQFQLHVNSPILMICPGAQYGSSKCWPEAHYAKVALHFLAQGGCVWLMGGPGEKPIVDRINQLVNNACADLTDSTLAEAIDLMSLANVVISNDSGMMHMAAALNKRLIAIFGSSSPDFTPPLSSNAHILSLEMECKPCFKRECPLKHHKCMVDITPEQVIKLL